VGPVGPCLTNGPGADQVNVVGVLELTTAIDNQTVKVGFTGGEFSQLVGGVPTLVAKFQDPPVGVAGAEADSIKIRYSK
jgi:hypothetical protein